MLVIVGARICDLDNLGDHFGTLGAPWATLGAAGSTMGIQARILINFGMALQPYFDSFTGTEG